MYKFMTAGISVVAIALISNMSVADELVYSNFPVTVQDYSGSKTTSVSYTGQIARHTLHDSLKKMAGTSPGKALSSADSDDPRNFRVGNLKRDMKSYFEGKDEGRVILAPKTKGPFAISQTGVDDISKGKNLAGKTYKGTISGMPNNMTGSELVAFWIGKAAEAEGGVDTANGYNYPQLISKFIMGAVFYNQVVDGYLDEYLAADKKPNNKPYKDGAAYTGKEHAWDEAFGYFGTPAHTLKLTAQQVYEIAKLGSKSKDPADALSYADYNNDGVVDLKTEMTFGPAYYASAFDKSGSTSYLHTITRAFLDGRKLITSANGQKLTDKQRSSLRDYAKLIGDNWEKVLAEATFKYAGSVYKDMMNLEAILDANGDIAKANGNYIKHWGELKGFSLALQTGKNNLGETATRLNRLIGSGPLLTNLGQVVDINSNGEYVRDQGSSWGEYMLHMLKVQVLLKEKFGIEALANDMTGEMALLTNSVGSGASAEND